MLNTETKEQILTTYQIETTLVVDHNPATLVSALEDIPHVRKVTFIREGSGSNVYVDCVITVDTFADDRFLWHSIKSTFTKVMK